MTFPTTRKRRAGLALAVAALAAPLHALAAPNPQTALAAGKIPQFAQALPQLNLGQFLDPATGKTSGLATIVTNTPTTGPLQLSMCEVQAAVLPPGTFAAGQQPTTTVWTYWPGSTCPPQGTVVDTYLGPVLVNTRWTPTSLRYTNALPTVDRSNLLAYKYSTDQMLHWADPLGVDGMPPEDNHCHMMVGLNPPQLNAGIPAYRSTCALNYGEFWDATTQTGGFYAAGIPAVPHLHGGEVPPAIDGGPDAWFTSGGQSHGHDYYTDPRFAVSANEVVYTYPNSQNASPLWFHDHTLGATRLNVYAGLAGAYYLLDPAQEQYFRQIRMRPVTEVVPVVLQDRMFDVNGQLYYPTDFPGGINGPTPNPQNPYWIPEFIGDTIVVNGKAWPFMNVEPRRYRFLFLNGSNARAYEMYLQNQKTGAMGPGFWIIGNDGGFLDLPAYVDPYNAANPHLAMQPGERYEIIIDFSKFAGQTLFVKNVAKAPYPAGKAPQGSTTGTLLQFRVGTTVATPDTSYDPASGISLRPTPVVRLAKGSAVAPGVTVSKIRQLTLNEAALLSQTATDPVTGIANTVYPGGPVTILVNNSGYKGETTRTYGDFVPVTINGVTERISETPQEGDVELWEIVNTTMDAHPIHTHLATFQIVNRQAYDQKKFMAAYVAGFSPANPQTYSALPGACLGAGTWAGTFCPGFGPPYSYDPAKNPLSGGKWGGNPDVMPYLANVVQPPLPQESGWKDTFIAYPGMVNRFLVRWSPQETAAGALPTGYPFSPNDGTNGSVGDSHAYVWHCHIIDHEDNDMMRQDVIVPLAGAPRMYTKGVDY